jgi:hypothetical protein
MPWSTWCKLQTEGKRPFAMQRSFACLGKLLKMLASRVAGTARVCTFVLGKHLWEN